MQSQCQSNGQPFDSAQGRLAASSRQNQRSEVGGQRAEDRGQKVELRGERSEVGGRRSENR